MIIDTLASTTTIGSLEHIGSDENTTTVIGSTISMSIATGITATKQIDIHHYYHYVSQYVESMSDEQLAQMTNLLEEKDDEYKVKTLTKKS